MSMPRILSLIFALASVLVALSTARVLFAPMTLVMPVMQHYLTEVPLAVLGHILFGPLALMVMPFQFWDRLRRNSAGLHRGLGYVYVVSVLIASGGALALLPHFPGTLWGGAGFLLLALAWTGTTVLAVAAARNGDLARHRVWMIRSAALTFSAVTLRLQLPFLFAAGYSLPAAYDLLAWDCWVPNLILVQLWLNAKRRVPMERAAW